jgi:hypothetical protein
MVRVLESRSFASSIAVGFIVIALLSPLSVTAHTEQLQLLVAVDGFVTWLR